jgi:hypothetical protein
MFPDGRSFDNVFGQAPGALLVWVQHHQATIDCRQDWQDLAYCCSSRAVTKLSLNGDEYLALATAAVLIYDRLAEVCPESSDRYSFSSSAMSLRAFLINKFGPQPTHPARNPATLEDWFFQQLDFSYEEAVSMARNVLKLSTQDFLRFSALRDRMRLMKCVQPQELFGRLEELSRWYELLVISSG